MSIDELAECRGVARELLDAGKAHDRHPSPATEAGLDRALARLVETLAEEPGR